MVVESKASNKRNILVVGSEYLFCSLIEYILESHGYEVEKAWDAKGASKLLNSTAPALIVLDSMMSESDSLQFLDTFRHTPYSSTTPIVLATSPLSGETLEAFPGAGAADVPINPVPMTDLESAVRRMLPL